MQSSAMPKQSNFFLSEEDLSKIQSLNTLSKIDGVCEEIKLIEKVQSVLIKFDLRIDEWKFIYTLSNKFDNQRMFLLELLIERAPSEELSSEILKLLPSHRKDEVMRNRLIWLNILELETKTDCKKFISPEERWRKLFNLFSDKDKYGHSVFGLSLKPNYLFEGYNEGKLNNKKWFTVWCQSNKNLSFIQWCDSLNITVHFVDYYTKEERKSFQIQMVDGQLYDNKNILIDTTNCCEKKTDCVMALDESFYCYATSSSINKGGFTHHSGIMSGKPVLFAGEIEVQKGIILKITTRSGHYAPSEKDLCKFLIVLNNNGIGLENIKLENDSERKISDNAQIYLEAWKEESILLKLR